MEVFWWLEVRKGGHSIKCSEFKERLFRAFSIDTNNDLPDIHPASFCYSCKQIMDKRITCYSSTAITEWEVQKIKIIVGLCYMHVFLMHRYVIRTVVGPMYDWLRIGVVFDRALENEIYAS